MSNEFKYVISNIVLFILVLIAVASFFLLNPEEWVVIKDVFFAQMSKGEDMKDRLWAIAGIGLVSGVVYEGLRRGISSRLYQRIDRLRDAYNKRDADLDKAEDKISDLEVGQDRRDTECSKLLDIIGTFARRSNDALGAVDRRLDPEVIISADEQGSIREILQEMVEMLSDEDADHGPSDLVLRGIAQGLLEEPSFSDESLLALLWFLGRMTKESGGRTFFRQGAILMDLAENEIPALVQLNSTDRL